MEKYYQPIVIKESENLIAALKESNFFEDYEIIDLTFTREHVLDFMTKKYIDNSINGDGEINFTEEEFGKLLRDIVAGTLLYELKSKGLVNSYEDEDTEQTFFLTEEGREYLKKNRENLF